MDWRDYITASPEICHGKPCMKGTRILVSVVLANLASEMTEESILQSYPALSHESIKAALFFAAELARERIVPLSRAVS